MPVQETSTQTYYNEVRPSLGRRQRVVYEALDRFPDMTNAELAQFLQCPINTITPRTNELVKAGQVIESGKRICKVTSRKVIAWKILRKKVEEFLQKYPSKPEQQPVKDLFTYAKTQ